VSTGPYQMPVRVRARVACPTAAELVTSPSTA